MQGKRREIYQDIGESEVEEMGRIETTHFRQDPPGDFTDPTSLESTAVGAKRRTTVPQAPLVENAPRSRRGVRSAWYITLSDQGETQLVQVRSAGQLADLPQNALPAVEYLNQLGQENPALAAELIILLSGTARHTAHHTKGADVGARIQALFRRAQLELQPSFQDRALGEGITVPPVRHRPKNPAAVTGPDGVSWD